MFRIFLHFIFSNNINKKVKQIKKQPSPWNDALSWTLDLHCVLFLLLRPTERERTECLIKSRLRSIMMYQDFENVTSKEVSGKCRVHKNAVTHWHTEWYISRQTQNHKLVTGETFETQHIGSSNVSRLNSCDQISGDWS